MIAAATGPAQMLCATESTEAARTAISSALEDWRSAFNDRDEHHVCDLFAPDLIANYQGQPERDYGSLCQLLLSSVQDTERSYHYSFDIDEILVFGATAIVRLVWTLEIEKNVGPKELIKEPAIDIFRCQDDGSWKISRYLAYPARS
jgi:ketosteroid isomerase-like protein